MGAKILIVDDSATSLMWHKIVLRQGEYDVVTAADGEAGVAAAKAEQPDLILMDVVMPKMSGIEAVAAIRALPGLRDVPIVMVSTLSEQKTVEASFLNGCSDYVVKPVDRAELLAKIESCLGTQPVAVASWRPHRPLRSSRARPSCSTRGWAPSISRRGARGSSGRATDSPSPRWRSSVSMRRARRQSCWGLPATCW